MLKNLIYKKIKSIPRFLILTISLYLFFIFLRGINFYDEGYIVNSAQRIVSGQTPYRDFHFAYTPGSILTLTFVFKLLGTSLLSERILMFIISIFSAIFIYKISYRITKSQITAYLSTLLFVFWGPGHINFNWPVIFILLINFIYLYVTLKIIDHNKTRDWFITGVLTTLSFVFKQNFFIPLLISSFLLLLLKKFRIKKNWFNYLSGLFISGFIFIIYLVITNSLSGFINDFYNYTINRIILQNSLSTSIIFSKNIFFSTLKILFYLLIPIISILSIVIAYKQKSK